MSVRYIFPNHPYVGYSLHDVDWIAEHLAPGWHISALWSSGSVVELVKIYNNEEYWHFFHNPEEQWLILTEDGVPFDFFGHSWTWRWPLRSLPTSRWGD